MKKVLVTGLVTILFTSFGCDTGTKSTPGGPGATRSPTVTSPTTATRMTDTTPDTAKNDTFKIKAPGELALKQGEKKEVTITVEREKNFKHDVTLMLSTSDKGIIFTPDTHTIKASDPEDAKFMISASKDAAVAEHLVTVKATPSEGAPTTATFKINVKGS